MKRNSFGKYREDQPSDSFDDCIDLDTGEIARPKPVKGVNEAYWNLLHWSENRRKDFKFINVKKQFKAFKIARENKINPPDLQAKWIEFEKDKFCNTKGFDWMDIIMQMDKKR